MIYTATPPRSLLGLATPFVLMLLATANLYAQQPMSISLTGSSEVTTTAIGSGQIMALPDHTISGSIKTSGMVPTVAHIHEAAAGKNGPPIITLSKVTNNSFAVPQDTKLTDAQYTSYMAGNLYVNVHSARHPSGEIRAQLPPGAPMLLAH